MQEKKHIVKMNDGGQIALHHFPKSNVTGLPVLLTHGTISNADTVRELALYLQSQGFDCWVLEWGGHGQSIESSHKQNFEYPAFHDTPAAIEKILQLTQQKQLHWVSHSGGGHLALMYLARNPKYEQQIASVVTLGAQATDGALGFKYKVRAVILWGVTYLMGHTPKFLVSVGTEGEPTRLLAQWSKWNVQQKWLGQDGFDYMANLARISVPSFMIAGQGDDIAPPSGCQKFHEAMGGNIKEFLVCSVESGFSKDFSHGQLIRGSAAKKEVYPKVSAWLNKHS